MAAQVSNDPLIMGNKEVFLNFFLNSQYLQGHESYVMAVMNAKAYISCFVDEETKELRHDKEIKALNEMLFSPIAYVLKNFAEYFDPKNKKKLEQFTSKKGGVSLAQLDFIYFRDRLRIKKLKQLYTFGSGTSESKAFDYGQLIKIFSIIRIDTFDKVLKVINAEDDTIGFTLLQKTGDAPMVIGGNDVEH